MEKLIKKFIKSNNEKLECVHKDIFVTSKITKQIAFNHFGVKDKHRSVLYNRVYFTYHFNIINGESIDCFIVDEWKSRFVDAKFVMTANYYNRIINKLNK